MAGINKYNDEYRVTWSEDGKPMQEYFRGENAEERANECREFMNIQYPLTKSPLRSGSTKNKSGRVGVFFCEQVIRKDGKKDKVYKSWVTSIQKDRDGNAYKSTVRFYLHKEKNEDKAYEKACKCRDYYESCVKRNRMDLFWDRFKKTK